MGLLSGEAFSTSVTSSLEYILTIRRAHSDSKSMRLASLAVIRLEGSFHVPGSSTVKVGQK